MAGESQYLFPFYCVAENLSLNVHLNGEDYLVEDNLFYLAVDNCTTCFGAVSPPPTHKYERNMVSNWMFFIEHGIIKHIDIIFSSQLHYQVLLF